MSPAGGRVPGPPASGGGVSSSPSSLGLGRTGTQVKAGMCGFLCLGNNKPTHPGVLGNKGELGFQGERNPQRLPRPEGPEHGWERRSDYESLLGYTELVTARWGQGPLQVPREAQPLPS